MVFLLWCHITTRAENAGKQTVSPLIIRVFRWNFSLFLRLFLGYLGAECVGLRVWGVLLNQHWTYNAFLRYPH